MNTMRSTTISILVITFTMYIGQIENAAVPPVDLVTATNDGVRAVPPVDPIEAIKAGVEISEKVLKTLKDAIESSAVMKAIEAEIKELKLVNDYLTVSERQIVSDAKVNLALAENEFTVLRIELSAIAELTKASTSQLIRITNRLVDDDSPRFNKQFEVIFKRFLSLLTITTQKLTEAKKRYVNMSTKLAETKGKLGAFSDIVEPLKDEHSDRYKEYTKKLRIEAYGSSATCLVFPPSCALVYPAVAIIIEGKIKDYKTEVDTLISKTQKVVASVTDMLEKIDNKDKELKEELELIVDWENAALMAKKNYGTYSITETIEEIKLLKEWAIDDFTALYKAAEAFNDWILNKA